MIFVVGICIADRQILGATRNFVHPIIVIPCVEHGVQVTVFAQLLGKDDFIALQTLIQQICNLTGNKCIAHPLRTIAVTIVITIAGRAFQIVAICHTAGTVASDAAIIVTVAANTAHAIAIPDRSLIFTNDTTGIIIAINTAMAVAIFHRAAIVVASNTAGIASTANIACSVAQLYCAVVIVANHTANLFATIEITIQHTQILDHDTRVGITEHANVASTMIAIQAADGKALTIKGAGVGIVGVANGCPAAELTLVQVAIFIQHTGIDHDIGSQFCLGIVITAVDEICEPVQILRGGKHIVTFCIPTAKSTNVVFIQIVFRAVLRLVAVIICIGICLYRGTGIICIYLVILCAEHREIVTA